MGLISHAEARKLVGGGVPSAPYFDEKFAKVLTRRLYITQSRRLFITQSRREKERMYETSVFDSVEESKA